MITVIFSHLLQVPVHGLNPDDFHPNVLSGFHQTLQQFCLLYFLTDVCRELCRDETTVWGEWRPCSFSQWESFYHGAGESNCLEENRSAPASAGNSLSNQSANKVWSVSRIIWPTSCIYGTKSGVGEAAGAAVQTGLPPGGPVPGNKQRINGSAGIAMSWLTHCRAVSHYPLNPDGDLPNHTPCLTYSRASSRAAWLTLYGLYTRRCKKNGEKKKKKKSVGVCACPAVLPHALCGPSLGRLLMCQFHGSFLSITAAGPGEPTSSPVTAPYVSHQRYHWPLVDQSLTLQRVWHTAVNKGATLSHHSRTVNEEQVIVLEGELFFRSSSGQDFYKTQKKRENWQTWLFWAIL